MKLHVLLKKEELDQERLPGKTVIVLDVLFATSSIVTVLANGASEVLPLLDGDAARSEAARRVAGSFVLAGELDAVTLEGFCHPTPLALLREDLRRAVREHGHDARRGEQDVEHDDRLAGQPLAVELLLLQQDVDLRHHSGRKVGITTRSAASASPCRASP